VIDDFVILPETKKKFTDTRSAIKALKIWNRLCSDVYLYLAWVKVTVARHADQLRIQGMASMARAMGATSSGAQKCLAQIKSRDLQFLQPLICAHTNNH